MQSSFSYHLAGYCVFHSPHSFNSVLIPEYHSPKSQLVLVKDDPSKYSPMDSKQIKLFTSFVPSLPHFYFFDFCSFDPSILSVATLVRFLQHYHLFTGKDNLQILVRCKENAFGRFISHVQHTRFIKMSMCRLDTDHKINETYELPSYTTFTSKKITLQYYTVESNAMFSVDSWLFGPPSTNVDDLM